MIGASHEVAIAYQAFHEAKAGRTPGAAAAGFRGARRYAVTDLSIERCDADGLSLHGSLKSRDGRRPHVALGVVRIDGTPVYGTTSEIDGAVLDETAAGNFEFALTFLRLALAAGRIPSAALTR